MAVFFDPTEVKSGNWTGAGWSAGGASPSFVPFTLKDINVDANSPFDAVSKTHDIAYGDAQGQLLNDLVNGIPVKQAVIAYMASLKSADGVFYTDASGAAVANGTNGYPDPHEEWVQALGVPSMDLKGALEASIIARLNDPNDSLLADLTLKFSQGQNDIQQIVNLNNGYLDYENNYPNDELGLKAVWQKNISDLAESNPLLKSLDLFGIIKEGLIGDPSLLPEAAAKISALVAYVGVKEIQSFGEAVGSESKIILNGTPYLISEVLDSLSNVGEATATFISKQVGDASK